MKALLIIALLLLPVVYAQEGIGTAITDTLEQAEEMLEASEDVILLAYLTQDKRMAVLQSTEILDNEQVEALIAEHEPKIQRATSDVGQQAALKKAIEDIPLSIHIIDVEEEIEYEDITEIVEEPILPISKEPSALCAILKDGVCEPECQGLDLDCDCGNGVCEQYENMDVCPQDCKPPTNYLCTVARDNACNPECPGFDIDCEVISLIDTTMGFYEKDAEFYTRIMIILSVIIVLLFVAGIWLLHDIHNIKLGDV